MSSQRKNTLKNLIKKGMFASTAALMLASTSALGTANRIVTVGGGSVDDGSAFGGGAYVAGSFITLGGINNFTADVAAIPAIYLNTFNAAVMTVPNDLDLGPVIPVDLNEIDVGLNINVTAPVEFTLTGTPVTSGVAGAAVPPFAPNPGPGQAPANTYYINSFNFNNTVSTLIIASTVVGSNNSIQFNIPAIPTSLAGAGNLTIEVNTPFIIKDPSWSNANTININSSRYDFATDSSFYFPGNEVVDIQPTANIKFADANSIYVVTNESKNAAVFKATADLVPTNDLEGQLTVHVAQGKRTISLNAGSGNGTAGTKRLNIFSTDGIANEAGQSLNDNPVTVTGTIFAQTIQIGNQYQPLVGGDTPYGVDWETEIDTGDGGVIRFTQNSLTRFQQKVISNIDFNGKAAQVTIAANADVGDATGGNIDNTVAGGANILNFVGSSTVTGNVGATNPINILNVQGKNATAVNLGGNVTVNEFNYTSTGVANVGGNLTAATGVNFDSFASTLTFNGANGPYTFASPVVAAGAATLNVDTNLTATNQTIGTIKTINIGQAGTPKTLTIAVNQTALGLLAGGNEINFNDSNSALILQSAQAQTVTFGGNLDGFAGGGGNVTLNGTNALTIQGSGGGNGSFGAVNKLGAVNIIGTVTAIAGANAINLNGITSLNLTGGSSLTDQSVTSAVATNINIGDGNGLATYILTPSANFNISTANMKFNNANSTLNITSTGNVTATMNGDLNPGAVAKGIILLSSTGGLLTINNANNLGINGGNTLNSITFAGTGNITVTPAINIANPLLTGIGGDLTLSAVNGAINFTNTTNLTVDDVTGKIDFVGLAGTTNVTDGGSVGQVTSSAAIAGTLAFAGDCTATGVVNNITNVSIDGNNTQIVTFEDDVTATNFVFTDTGVAEMEGNLTSSGGVNFNNFAATLAFTGVGGPYTFASPVVAAGNATLNVDTTLTATNQTIGAIKTINIGQANAAEIFTIAVNQNVLSLLAAGGVINFNNANSALIVQPGQAQALTFGGNLEGTGGGGGLLTFDASGGAMTLAGATGAETIGATDKLTAIDIKGNVTLLGAANKFDISGTGTLNLKAGSVFTDQSLTSPDIAAINIGEVAGAATYALDAVNGNFDLTPGVTFGNQDSILQLQTTIATGGNSLITLQGDIDPGAANTGIIQINASNTNATLTIAGAFNVGTAVNTVQEMNFTGNGTIIMQQPTINSASPITTSVTFLTLGNISAINFTGPTNLTVGNVAGNIALGNQAGIVNLTDGSTITGTVNGSSTATLNFLGAGTVNNTIGANNALAALNFNGPGDVNLQQIAKATTFTINDPGAIVTAAGLIGGNLVANNGQFTGTTILGNVSIGTAQVTSNVSGNVNFIDDGTLTTTIINSPGQIDFAGKGGTVNVNNNGGLSGNVTSSAATAGNLVFKGAALLSGGVSNINAISINGVAGSIVNFTQNVSATSLAFTNGATAKLQGSLGTVNNAVAIDFGAVGGILQFSGTNSAGYLLNSPITNGNTGTLNVYTTGTTLTATDSSIGTVNTINIGQANAAAAFTVDVSKGLLTLLQPPGSTIDFGDTNSVFGLTTNANQQVTFANSFGGFAGGGGSVNLSSTNGAKLEIQGLTGAETLGKVGAALAAINVTAGSEVGVVGGDNSLNVSNAAVLNIANGGVFADQSITSAQIAKINIGDNNGPGTYALDALNGDFPLNAPGVTFVNPASVFKLMTTVASGNTSTITLTGDIDPGAPNTGILELNATNANAKLTIAGKFALGTKVNPLKAITFSGKGLFELEQVINTDLINLDTPGVAIADINADVNFQTKSQLDTGSITGNVNFNNNAGTIILDSKATVNYPVATITGNVTSTGGTNGTIQFVNDGTIGTVDGNGNSTNTITNLAMLQAGADNSTVMINAGGNMSIAEIQGTGTGNIVFTQATDLTGGINLTGGTAVNLTFNNGGSILGNAGSNTAIGNITILDGTLSLGVPGSVPDSVLKGNAIYLGPNAIVKYDSSNISFDVFNYVAPNSFNILAAIPIDGGIMYNDNDPETDNKQRGQSNSPLGIIQVNGNDVTITGPVYVNNVKFTSPQSVTLTLANTSVVGGATTTGNKIHTLAITGDLTTGTLPFGSDSNHLKTIQLNSDGTFHIKSQDVFTSVTTKTNNEGSAIFEADSGFTDDLGGENLNLKLVQFSSNKGTVKGDTYAKNITIDAGKSAIFTGYNSRSLDIPSATVGGVKVPRATTKFSYKTKIVSEDFKGSSSNSSAEYTNAALVQAPINGGSHKFNDDVWLQKAVTGTNTITFAPKKTAFIASNLGANTIVADQATMMFTGDNTKVNVGGNISGRDITFDLGNNQVTYTGSATPTGELIINVFYDTINAGQTGNANSGNIVLASGSTFDLSNVSSIKIFLTAQNNPSAIGEGSAYPVISGGNIIVGNAASLPFKVTANEGGFVRWQITGNSFVLLPVELTGDVTVDNIIGKIIKAPPGSDAAKVAHVLVNTPIDQRPAVIKHLLPIIERPSNEIHRVTTPLITPMGPSVGPSVGGFSPLQPPPTSGSVVNNIYVPPTIPGGYDVTPSNPAGYNTPITGGSVGGFGPNGPGTGGTTGGNIGTGGGSPSVGTGGFGPNGPGTGGTTGGNIGTGGGSPSIGSGGTTPTGGSVSGGVFTPNGPSVVAPSGPATGGSVGGFGPNGPGTGGTTGGNIGIGGGSPSVGTGGTTTGGNIPGGGGFGTKGPGTGGATGTTGNSPVSTGGNPYGPSNVGTIPTSSVGGNPSVSTGGTTGGNIGTGGTSYSGPASGGSPTGYVPSIPATSGSSVGTGGTSYNGPASGGSVGTGGTSYNGPASGGSVGTGGTSYNGPASGGSVGTGGTSYNSPASGGSVGTGGTSYNGSASGGSVGTGGTSYNGPASGGSVGTGGSSYGGGAGANGGVATGGSSYNNPAATGITPANSGNSSAQGSSSTLGGATKGGVTNSGSSPYGNSGNPATTGISPTNNSNGIGGSSDSGMPAIGRSRDNSSGTGSGGNSGSGISRANANDGFNAAHDNTNTGAQEVGKRLDAIKDADGTNPNSEEAVSRKRGAAVGGGDCELDEGNANNSVYGVWVSPYYGKAVQKAFNGLSGYRAKSTGGSIGVDTVINDNIVLGAAYTRVDTKLRYQNAKAGNTTKVGTNMGSIYGLYNFINNWFVEGVTTYSRSDIKTNELRNIIGGYETVHGKYHSTSYSGQVVGGYNYLWKETSFAPMAGLRLTKIKDSGYQEYGTSFQNLTIQKRQYNKVEGILGGEIKTTFYKDEFIIRPQVHAFINYDFKGKTPAIGADLNGLNEPLPVPAPKPTKMLYDLGAGVVVKKGRMEYGVHYGLNLAKKYHAQSGTLRLKVNF